MEKIIDGKYEVICELGAGGGGVVYLANHLRLGKKVVLKADKRSLNTRAELLRREVDILKELNHSYIPQVYDYFVENGLSYTVMDFVDGESLNKVLEREKSFSQATVIHWARQLLEALIYLHSPTHGDPPRGFIHSDIKPGNIMLRPNGDICLIDYNISLAIGVESIVGRSPGYSSPEHYGLNYSEIPGINKGTGETTIITAVDDETQIDIMAATKNEIRQNKKSELSSSLKRVTVLDARSDIYSVGATLYHLLSGKRPANDAKKVEMLSKKLYSPLLVDIITKAMNPDPEKRFSSAEEMLTAINRLWHDDPRVKRRKRIIAAFSVIMSIMLAFGGVITFIGMRQMERLETAHVLTSKSQQSLSEGDVDAAISYAMDALPDTVGLLDIPYTAQAQLALTEALGVYDLTDSFKPYMSIELPSSPFRITKSPDESKLIACYAYEIAVYEFETGSLLYKLPTLESALCEVEFLDNDIIVYGGINGLTAYDLKKGEILWKGDNATAVAVSADKSTVASINGKDDRIVFYDSKNGNVISERLLNGKHLNIPENDRLADADRDVFELSYDGSLCAVSLDNGYLGFKDIFDQNNDMIIYDESEYTVFDGCFVDEKFVFTAAGENNSVLGIVDWKNGIYMGEMEDTLPFKIECDNEVLYVAQNDLIVEFDLDTFEQTERAYMGGRTINSFDVSKRFMTVITDKGYTLFNNGSGIVQDEERERTDSFTVITDNYVALADRDTPYIEILRLREHEASDMLVYDSSIIHNETRILSDGSGAILFDISSFTILDADGCIKKTVLLPDSDSIYDQQFRKDGDYLEITYYSGEVVCYSAANGEIISATNGIKPDKSLDEEFETEKYLIKAPLHGVPVVYDKLSGEIVAELESSDYLTYITEVGEYIAVQYISTDGTFYGIIINRDCETIAKVPYLCDIYDGRLVCDLPSGNIRISTLYELDELKIMADNIRNKV